ncbi:MAG: DUF2231 domain-containing protein [Vicinamibacterales bacterium]
MPMGLYHPQIVHFAIGLLIVGVAFRVVSLAGRPAFAGPAATTLILLGTVAIVLAASSGVAAHGPVERVPGARGAVVEHEEWGLRARNIFLGVAALELLGLALRRSSRAKLVSAAAALVGVVGAGALFEAGAHGGVLVYSYAGGVGIRSGDAKDVERLLLAGLYNQAMLDRKNGDASGAAALADQMSKRFPGESDVQLFAAESRLVDMKDATAALETLRGMNLSQGTPFTRMRHASLSADAYEALGQKDSAIAALQSAVEVFPNNARLKDRLAKLKGESPKP